MNKLSVDTSDSGKAELATLCASFFNNLWNPDEAVAAQQCSRQPCVVAVVRSGDVTGTSAASTSATAPESHEALGLRLEVGCDHTSCTPEMSPLPCGLSCLWEESKKHTPDDSCERTLDMPGMDPFQLGSEVVMSPSIAFAFLEAVRQCRFRDCTIQMVQQPGADDNSASVVIFM